MLTKPKETEVFDAHSNSSGMSHNAIDEFKLNQEDGVYEMKKIKVLNGKIIVSKKELKRIHKFETLIIILIILSSITLCIDTPLLNPNSFFKKFLRVLDLMFTLLFAFEATLKIITLGFFTNNIPKIKGYIFNWWNLLDFFVVIASLTDMYFTVILGVSSAKHLKSLKALRVFRALRPLRMVSRNEGLKVVVNSLFSAIPGMTNVICVCIIFITIFSIMGVNLFKGKFYSCAKSENYNPDIYESISSEADCDIVNGFWTRD